MTTIREMILEKERERASGMFATSKDKAALEKLELAVKHLDANSPPTDDFDTSRFRIVSDLPALDAMISDIASADALVVKVVATGTDVFKDAMIGISITRSADYGYFVACSREPKPGHLETSVVVTKLKALVEAKEIVGHDLKAEYKWFKQLGVTINVAFDTMLAVQLLDESKPAGLNEAARRLLDVADNRFDLEGWSAGDRDVREVGCYAIRSAIHVFRLYKKLLPIMRDGYEFVFFEVEVPAVGATGDMELAGLPVDLTYVADMTTKAEAQRAELVTKIQEAAGHPFDINSPVALTKVLFEELKLPVTKTTKTGDASTDADALRRIGTAAHPIVGMIISFRKCESILKTLAGIEINPTTGRVHATYAQMDAKTGRMISGGSAFHPQGIPKDGTFPFSVRSAVGGVPGMVIVPVDYKAQEIRLVAAQAGEEKLATAIEGGLSPHGYTAKKLFGLKEDPDKVKDKHPDKYAFAKAVNFGIIFGETAFGLARDLTAELGREVTAEEAQKTIDAYFAEFSAVKTWVEATKTFARTNGFVRDLVGRKRRFQVVHHKAKKGDTKVAQQQETELRQAVNFLAQGLAASQSKRAMARCNDMLKTISPRTQLVAMRHDELIFLAPEEEIDVVCAAIKTAMEDDPELVARGVTVKPEVEITFGKTWSNADQQEWVVGVPSAVKSKPAKKGGPKSGRARRSK